MASVRSHIPLAQNRLSVSAHHPLCAVSVHNDVSDVCVDKHRMAWSAAQQMLSVMQKRATSRKKVCQVVGLKNVHLLERLHTK